MDAITHHFEAALAGSPVYAVLLAYAAGVLTCFTPCVLPLFPVAVGTITASARRRKFVDGRPVDAVTSRSRAFFMGMMYALGLSVTYSALGLFAALSGKAVFGAVAGSPVTNAAMAAVMLLLALWMWKGDRLDPGAWLQNMVFSAKGRAGPLGRMIRWYAATPGGGAATTFGFGFVSGLLAGPCTAPVIAMVLTYVATLGAIAYGVLLMTVYALGLATPMVVAGMSATLAMRLGGKGALARGVKIVFVGVMLLMCGYFLHRAAYFGGLIGSGPARTAATIYRIADVEKEGPPKIEAIRKGARLPDFGYEPFRPRDTAESGRPKRLRLSDLRGKVVLLPFWGIWCRECLEEIPEVKNFARRYAEEPRVVVLSINVLDPQKRVPAFVAKEGIFYDVVMDEEGKLIERLGAFTMPLNMILAPDGTIAYSATVFPKGYAGIVDALLKKEAK